MENSTEISDETRKIILHEYWAELSRVQYLKRKEKRYKREFYQKNEEGNSQVIVLLVY
jgi:hypothetical protein